MISWQLFRFRRASEAAGQESETHDFEAGIVPTAWDRPPLPLYTRGAELWAEPLAHASILLGFLAVSLAVVGWREYEPPVWSLSAVSLAAVVWLLATGTRRLGILRLVTVQGGLGGPGPARALSAPDLSDQQERIALYVLGLTTVYGAVHATVHTVLLRDPEFSAEVISWHLLVAASLSLVGWMIATGYSAWCNSRLARVATEGEMPIRDRLAFYAGWLHHVILVIATLDFIVLVCMTFLTLRESSRGIPTSVFAAGLHEQAIKQA